MMFSCLQGHPNLLFIFPHTANPLGPFLIPPLLWKPSWLNSTNIWSLGLLFPKRNICGAIFSIALHYIIPGAGPICWIKKHPPVDWHGDRCSLLPHPLTPSAGFLFPSQTWEQLVLTQPSEVSSCPCFLLVFSDPSCGAQGRASDSAARAAGANRDTWTWSSWEKESRSEHKSHQCWKWGKAVCQLIFPILLSSKKRSRSETQSSSACEARWSLDACQVCICNYSSSRNCTQVRI